MGKETFGTGRPQEVVALEHLLGMSLQEWFQTDAQRHILDPRAHELLLSCHMAVVERGGATPREESACALVLAALYLERRERALSALCQPFDARQGTPIWVMAELAVFEAVVAARGWEMRKVCDDRDVYVEARDYKNACMAGMANRMPARGRGPVDDCGCQIDSIVTARFRHQLREVFGRAKLKRGEARRYLERVGYDRARSCPEKKFGEIAKNWRKWHAFVSRLIAGTGRGATALPPDPATVAKLNGLRQDVYDDLLKAFPRREDRCDSAAQGAIRHLLADPRNYRYESDLKTYLVGVARNMIKTACSRPGRDRDKALEGMKLRAREAYEQKEAERRARRARAAKGAKSVKKRAEAKARRPGAGCLCGSIDGVFETDPSLLPTSSMIFEFIRAHEIFLTSVFTFRRTRKDGTLQWPVLLEMLRLRLEYRAQFGCLPSAGELTAMLLVETGVLVTSLPVVDRRMRLRVGAGHYADAVESTKDELGDASLMQAVRIRHLYALGRGCAARHYAALSELDVATMRTVASVIRASRAGGDPDRISGIIALLMVRHGVEEEELRRWVEPLIEAWEHVGLPPGCPESHLGELRSRLGRAIEWFAIPANKAALSGMLSSLRNGLAWAGPAIWLLSVLKGKKPAEIADILRVRPRERAAIIAAASTLPPFPGGRGGLPGSTVCA